MVRIMPLPALCAAIGFAIAVTAIVFGLYKLSETINRRRNQL